MRLNIQYGIEREVERVLYTLHKYEWYQKQGYKVFLPDGVDVESTKEDIHRKIQKVYDFSEYHEKGKRIEQNFSNYSQLFGNALTKVFEILPEEIELVLTRYGVGGSYRLPSTVLFNIQYTIGVENLFHEVVHLCIEPYIKKYAVSHWEKERVVDLILHSKEFAFLKYSKWQKNYHSAEERVDELFRMYFPGDLERLFVGLSK